MKTNDTYIALLRAVNVGGNNLLPMKALTAMCEDHGCSDVRTYIQSGNVIFRSGKTAAKAFAKSIQRAIKKDFGFETDVIVRSTLELQKVAGDNPYLKRDVDSKFLHVVFLAAEPVVTDVVALNPVCVGEEGFSLKGSEIYLYLPNGSGNSKLASYPFGKKLGVPATVRNWQTVNKLLELAAAL